MSPPIRPPKQPRGFLKNPKPSVRQDKNFRIVQVEEDKEDEMHYSELVRHLVMLQPITAAAAVVAGYRYWKLQFSQLLLLQSLGLDMNTRLIFAVIDFLLSMPTTFKAILDMVSILTPAPRRPYLQLRGDKVPTVDIIITACNEPFDVVLDTARAAINIDYPASRFRVIVADDGASQELKDGVIDLAKSKPESLLFYTARVKGENDRHKAGNLNHTLKFASSLPGGAAEFVSGLDADMIPMRDILRAQMPHLLRDPNMGLTCPAATFYNVPVNDWLLQSQTVHNKWEEFSRDRINDAWCTGSGWVARRRAIDELGGVPMQTIGEDAFMSTGISNLGWNTAFIPQSLQYGLVPDTYGSHLKQHRRWKLGGLIIGMDKRFGLWGKNVKRLSWKQRLWWFYYPFGALTMPLTTLGLFTAPLFMLAGTPWVVYATDNDLKALAQAAALSFITTFILKCHMSLKTGFRAQMMEQCNNIWISPCKLPRYHTITQLKTFVFPTWLGGQLLTFVPTGSIPNDLHERNAKKRAGLQTRLRSILIKDGAIFHLLFAAFCAASAISVTVRAHRQFPQHGSEFGVYLLTHLGWMPMPWLFSFFACLTPIYYAVFPPTVPDREDLLTQDPLTGAHVIYIHTNARPAAIFAAKDDHSNFWTHKVFEIPGLEVRHIEIPTHTKYGAELEHMEHRSDFVRPGILRDFGGIYLDFDVVPIRDMKPLRESGFKNVFGHELGEKVNNGVMLSIKNSRFMDVFDRDQHEVFSGWWIEHSVLQLTRMTNALMTVPNEVLILERHAFIPDGWDDDRHARLFRRHPSQAVGIEDRQITLEDMNDTVFSYWNWSRSRPRQDWELDYSKSYTIHALSPPLHDYLRRNPLARFTFLPKATST
ncbi:hypothetical protein DHEL01_v206851 [Diaporthe helianthi]|uniref:Glycosyltransferase 2-like domain-containing protein n=1 Tax=Diaporthe helianthi TaxID=158607 RepID=A0A2P5HWW8_DIAHE|nr:hypothetical protein DHEL01_v206851 [Diaporthe helianthi]